MKYNNCYWAQIPQEGQDAASKLGYDQDLWDADILPDNCRKSWADLDETQREGAQELGYEEKSWNNFLERWMKSVPATMKYNNCYWEQLPPEGKEAAQKLGYSQESWDADILPENCKELWQDLDEIQRQGAQEMGYDENSWNGTLVARKKAKYSMYFSHLCFVLGSIFYLKVSVVCIQWDQYVGYHKVPRSVLEEDDDDVWEEWAYENDLENILNFREYYWVESERNNLLGACSYAVMGLVEMYIQRNSLTIHNLLIPLGGFLGMTSALNVGGNLMKYSGAASVTNYLLSCTKLDFFFVGSAIECIVAYAYLAGFDGAWLLYLDAIASLMWLYCAVIGVAAEFNVSLLTRFFPEKKVLQSPRSPLSNGQEKDERHRQ